MLPRLPTLAVSLAIIPAVLAVAAIDGAWTGTVTAPQGDTALALIFTRRNQHLIAAIHMPVMHVHGVGFEAAEKPNGEIAIPALNTTMQRDGDTLTGLFALGKLPVRLRRGGATPPAPSIPIFAAAPAPSWTYPLGSPTWSAPLVHDGVVYLGTSEGKFHAVNARNGRAIWTWDGENRLDGRATAAGDAVFFIDGKNELVCLNRAEGTLRWRTSLHDETFAPRPTNDNPTFNRRTAIPLVIDQIVYAGSSDGGLYAVAVADGKRAFRFDARSPVFSGITRQGADRLIFGCMDGAVITLDRRTAREVSRVRTGGGVVTTPVLAGGNLIVGSRDYTLHAFRARDGAPAWTFSYWFSWVESTPAVADDVIFVGASDYRRVTAFDAATGVVRWATDVRGLAWGTPLVTADRVFIGTVAQNIPGTAISHTGGIMALDRMTGAVQWHLPAAPAPVNSFGGYAGSLAVAGDFVIAAGFDGTLIALPARLRKL